MRKRTAIPPWPRLVTLGAGGLSAALGIVVIVGWLTRSVLLVQVHPAFVPMQFNTALGFLLCGAGLVSLAEDRRRTAGACGAVAGVIGLLTLVEYLFGLALGIDQLLVDHYITVETSHAGRMAPNTAVSFSLSGAALVYASRADARGRRPLVLGLLGAVVIAFGTVAFFGYLSHVETAYGWGNLTRMAVHTAIGFGVVGAGSFAFAWSDSVAVEPGPPRWIALPVMIGLTTLAVALFQALDAHATLRLRQVVSEKGELIKTQLWSDIEPRSVALLGMARHWEARGRPPREEWETDAAFYVKHQAGCRAIEWVDLSLRVRWVVPLEGNESQVDLDLSRSGRRRRALEEARDERKLTFTRSIVSGKAAQRAFVINVPLFQDGEFAGYLAALYDIGETFDVILEDVAASGFSVLVTDGEEAVYRHTAGGETLDDWVYETELENGLVRIWPGGELLAEVKTNLPLVALFVGILVALLTALTVQLAQTGRDRSRELRRAAAELEMRNAELARLNAELEDFTSIASHDLQEPLQKLLSFTRLLESDLGAELSKDARTDLHFIRSGVLRMGVLVRDLLALSQAGAAEIKRERVAVDQCVDRALEDLELRVTEAGAQISRDPLPEVNADPTLVTGLYRNLLSNAVKFANGTPRITLTARQGPDGWILGCSDAGIGLPRSQAEEIFKPFHRLHPQDRFDGSGIGLAFCRKVVERHGGRIWVDSNPGRGVHFQFTLGDQHEPDSA